LCPAKRFVAHLGVVDGDHPIRAHPCPEGDPVLRALDVLPEQLRQQCRCLAHSGGFGLFRRQTRERALGEGEQAVGVGDDRLEEGPPRRRVVPIDPRRPLETRPTVPPEVVRQCPLLWRTVFPRGQGAQQQHDAVGEEVVGVLDRAPAEDIARVQGGGDPAALEIAHLPGEGQALLEDGADLLVQDQLRAEELQGALGKGARLQADTQRHLPAQIEVGARLRLVVGHVLEGLEEQRGRQQARGDTWPPVIRAVERREVLIAEELLAPSGEESIEGLPAYKVEVGMFRLTLRHRHSALAQHRSHLLAASREVYPSPPPLFGRTSRDCGHKVPCGTGFVMRPGPDGWHRGRPVQFPHGLCDRGSASAASSVVRARGHPPTPLSAARY
jgi:hypothetical protein